MKVCAIDDRLHSEEEIMVLHTLVVDPEASGKGFGTAFVRFYEDFARKTAVGI